MSELKKWNWHGTHVRKRVKGRSSATAINRQLSAKLSELAQHQPPLRPLSDEKVAEIKRELEARERERQRGRSHQLAQAAAAAARSCWSGGRG